MANGCARLFGSVSEPKCLVVLTCARQHTHVVPYVGLLWCMHSGLSCVRVVNSRTARVQRTGRIPKAPDVLYGAAAETIRAKLHR